MTAAGLQTRPRLYHGWIVAGMAFLALALVFGGRFSLGLFIPFLPEALDATAGSVSLVFAVSMLTAGAFQPIAGIMADRLGSRFVLLLGLGFGGAAFAGTGLATELWQVALFMAIGGGIAFACVSPVLATSLMTQWFSRHRGRALAVVTSGGKVAMVVLVPILSVIIALFGWRYGLVALGLAVWALIPLIWILVRSSPEEMGLHPDGDAAPQRSPISSAGTAAAPDGTAAPAAERWRIPQALRTGAFWLLAVVLFGNGFVMNLVFLHLPSYILEQGYGQALAAGGLTVLGAVGIAGNLVIGTLSDRLDRKHVLALLFAARGLVTLLIVIAPNPVSLIVFAVVFGLLGYGAIAVIGSITAHLFGRASIGTIMGAAYVLNQLGGACGIYAGGLSYDLTGAYEPALLVAVVTAFVSFLAVLALPRDSLPMPPAAATAGSRETGSERRV